MDDNDFNDLKEILLSISEEGEGIVSFPVSWFDIEPEQRASLMKDWIEILTSELNEITPASEFVDSEDLH
jgi:hypothetical protein